MKRFYTKFSSGFTLIELLVVITILGVLATLALVTLNPAEAQKKARDTQRLKDMATLQSIVEQYLTDNPGSLPFTVSGSGNSGTGTTPSNCLSGWLSTVMGSANLCRYANVIPIDPSNRSTSVTTNTGTLTTQGAFYNIRFTNGTYKICTYLESTANGGKLTSDGETNAAGSNVFATFSAPDIACP